MAIFRPEIKQTGTSNFFGVCELGIEKIECKADMYDWADIYIDVTVKQKGSEYTRNMRLVGSLEKDATGNITGGSVLKRVYNFFDVIGCKAGLNVKGTWEDENGIQIENIGEYLNKEDINPLQDFDYVGYVYKEKPKKAGDKAWTKVYPKIYANTSEGKSKLESDIKWLKEKGYLKEFTGEPEANGSNEIDDMHTMSNL